jgi:hypothetical protein
MARLRILPHDTASEESFGWHGWWMEDDRGRSSLPSTLKGWDYASGMYVGISVDVDERAVQLSTGLASIDNVEILILADCPATQRRLVGRTALWGRERGTVIDIAVHLPPGEVAEFVNLSAHVVVARTTAQPGYRVPYLHGARIQASERFTLYLEGDASRFPTEPVSFRELGYEQAPWTVLTSYEDLSESFMGGVRLLINMDHPIGQLALAPATAPKMEKLLRADVLRILVAKASGQVEEADESAFDEGNVGHVLDAMCQGILNCGLRAAASIYRDDPARFERLLDERLDPLAGVLE